MNGKEAGSQYEQPELVMGPKQTITEFWMSF